MTKSINYAYNIYTLAEGVFILARCLLRTLGDYSDTINNLYSDCSATEYILLDILGIHMPNCKPDGQKKTQDILGRKA